MPIVVVTALPADPPTVNRLLDRLVSAVADGVACPVGDVWVSYVPATAQHIGQRSANAADQHPIVVIRGRARGDEQVAAGMRAAAVAVSTELGVPVEDVWVQWIDVVTGRAFAGGDLIA